jgi:fibronectin-binding autotransporter adhesin
MTNPQTFYTVGGQDLSGIFQPLGSLIQALSTDYKIPDGRDLNQIFASISSGSQIGYDTGFKVNNGNYSNIDLRQIFAANNTITPTGTFTSATNSGYTIVSFTANSGTLNISSTGSNTFYYLVVGGGGPGGSDAGGGGGAGGVVQGTFSITGSKTINIVVGAGGIVTYSTFTENGHDSSLSYDSTTIIGTGGGYGGWASGWGAPKNQAANGGCGGGCGTNTTTPGIGSQGKNGGTSGAFIMGGGGGGMNTNGGNGSSNIGGNGGNGILCTQNGINLIYPSTYWGGGGGGGAGGSPSVAGNGGLGGGGGGASSSSGGVSPGTQGIGGSGLNSGQNGTATKGGNGGANTGGGGGGGPQLNSGGNGGSGIVVIAYLTP